VNGREAVAWLAAETELMEADLASGMVPDGVTRPLYSHEVHTDFAGLEADVDRLAGELARLLEADRAKFIDLLAADLAAVARNPGPDPVDVAVAARLLQLHATLGIAAVAGATALVEQAEIRYRQLLAQAAQAGAARVVAEAARMGVDTASVAPKLPGLDEYRIDLAARRLALSPHTDVLDAAAAAAYQLPGVPAARLLPDVVDDLRGLSPQPLLTTMARPAVQQADGLGRQGAMSVLPPAKGYYASELLDRNTCQPCERIDGTVYATLADAKVDYPAGGYRNCAGGDRCRGTIVAVWGTEQGLGE
jgi:hypothetical protein